GQRNLANFLSNANADRISKGAAYRTTGLDAESRIPGMYSGLYGPSISGATGELNAASGAARTPGFWDTFGPALIGGAATVGAGFTPKGCWIAEAIYGVDDIRTHMVRAWLNEEFSLRPVGKYVMKFYHRFGQRIAAFVKKSRFLAAVLRPLFDAALSRYLGGE